MINRMAARAAIVAAPCALSPPLREPYRPGRFLDTPEAESYVPRRRSYPLRARLWHVLGPMRMSEASMSGDKETHGPHGQIAPEDREAIRKRSEDLGRRLDEAKQRKDGPTSSGQSAGGGAGRGQAMSRALRVSTELIGGILVGSAIGWFLDGWLGNQKPWFFVLFFLLGAAAGMLNVIRMAMREKTPQGLPSVRDDADENR